MYWTEAIITTTSEAVDILSGVLLDEGINGFEIDDKTEMKNFLMDNPMHWDYIDDELMGADQTDVLIKFHVTDDQYGMDTIKSIENRLTELTESDLPFDFGKLTLQLKKVNDENWLDHWKKYYKPFKVGKNIVIKPTWETYLPKGEELIFHINPGHVFGTGLHQSTKMAIAFLEQYIKPDDLVADLGCGSGILSILSLMLGAKEAYGCDIDSAAYSIAYENAELNQIDQSKYFVQTGNIITDHKLLQQYQNKVFDIVVANIVADVIIDLSEIIPKFIKKEGLFITSGIISQRHQDVIHKLKENGFERLDTATMDEWVSCVFIYRGCHESIF